MFSSCFEGKDLKSVPPGTELALSFLIPSVALIELFAAFESSILQVFGTHKLFSLLFSLLCPSSPPDLFDSIGESKHYT